MLRASIFQKNILEKSNKSEEVLSYNNCLVDITSTQIKIYKEDKLVLNSKLEESENDFNTTTFLGNFSDGTTFRVIRPNEIPLANLKNEFNCISAFSIASLNQDDYAIHFILTDRNDVRNNESSVNGQEEQIQKLLEGCVLALQNKLHQNFIDYSKRILKLIETGSSLKEYKFGPEILQIMNDNNQIYSTNEKAKLSL